MKSVLITLVCVAIGLYAAVGVAGLLAGMVLSGSIERREMK